MPSTRTSFTAGHRPTPFGSAYGARAGFARDVQPRFHPGQLVLRLRDETVLEILDRHPISECYLLEDYSWVSPREIEDPLSAGRRRDIERAERRDALQHAIESGDFDAVFPGCRRSLRQRRSWGERIPAVTGWTLALLEGAVLAGLVSGAL